MIDRFDGTEYRFLSNFWLADVKLPEFLTKGQAVEDVLDNLVFPSTEHAYQAAKSMNMGHISACASNITPGQAKKLGRHCDIRSDWEQIKVRVMMDLVRQKFSKHYTLGTQLLNTGDEELVEGNTWGDRFWGQVDGVGENWLGKILMFVRDEIRSYRKRAKLTTNYVSSIPF